MNLTSRKARTLIALCSTAAVIGAGVTVGVTAATATGTLTLTPAGITSFTTPDLGFQFTQVANQRWTSPQQALNDATFGVGVTTTNTQLVLVLDTAPSVSAGLFYGQEVTTAHTGPAVAGAGEWSKLTKTTPGTTDTSGAANGANSSVALTGNNTTKSTYFTADTPGTYTVHFADTAGGDPSAPIAVSDELTITVKDVEASTLTTADDWNPTVSAPSTLGFKGAMSATVSLSPFTTTDSRGTTYVPADLGLLIGIKINGAAHIEANPLFVSVDGTSVYRGLAVNQASMTAQTLTSSVWVDKDGDADLTTNAASFGTSATTVVSANDATVTGVTNGATNVVGSVLKTGANVAVKVGTTAVTYSSTMTDSDATKADTPVYFTLTTIAGSPTLTATGTRVGRVSSTAVVYAVNTDATGVASITVTSSSTVAGVSYSVNSFATGNNGAAMTALYAVQDPDSGTITLTNTAAQLVGTPGSSVTLTGTLKDNFGALYQPTASEGRAVDITTTLAPTAVTGTLSGGVFTATYTPSATPTAGTTTSVTAVSWTNQLTSNTLTDASAPYTITWASAADPASITFSAPTANFTPTIQSATAAPQGGNKVTITGVVRDASSNALAGKIVTVPAITGVYYTATATPSATDPFVTSMSTATDGTGSFTVYAWPTKSGSLTLSATTGSVTQTVTGTVSTPLAAAIYRVVVDDVSGVPGTTLTITGTATDGFGNGLPGVIDLSLSDSTLGHLGAAQVTASNSGSFTTTFIPASAGAAGSVTLTAKANVLSVNPTADGAWATDGVTVATGQYQDTATITLAAETVTLTAPATRNGAGSVTLTGTTTATKTVKVYSKNAGSSDAYVLLGTAVAGSDGSWTYATSITRSKTFIASINSDDIYSDPATVTVRSTVTLAASARGHRIVRLTANGNPDAVVNAKFYMKVGSSWRLIRTVRTNSAGVVAINYTAPVGYRYFKVIYQAPGTTAGTASIRVRVR